MDALSKDTSDLFSHARAHALPLRGQRTSSGVAARAMIEPDSLGG
jgi:hypothetical protein